jgi:asparagine synthase (glutamine-hydrolysing)
MLPGHFSFQNLALPPALAIARKHCHGFFPDNLQRTRLYGPGIRDRLETPAGAVDSYAEPFLRHYERVKDRGPLAAALYLELKTYLVDDILTKVDRMSMAHSLEVRVPFLDHKMVELALAVPAEWKVDWRRGKRIYRDAFGDLLPPEIWPQKKRGFDIPAASWLRGRLRERAEEILLDAGPGNLLNRREVERFWTEHRDGSADHSRKLWALLLLGIWIGNLEAARAARRSRSSAAAAASEGK